MTKSPAWTTEQILLMWPQAAGELAAFQRALEQRAGLTASQLRMAIQLAQERFAQLTAEAKPKEEPSLPLPLD